MDLLWRRLAAGVIDIVLAVMAAGLVAAAAYSASGGVVRMGVPSPVNACTSLRVLDAEIVRAAAAAAPGYTPSGAAECVERFMGLETGRHLVVAMTGADARVVFVPVAPGGAMVKPLALGWLAPVAFILLKTLAESLWGGTPGKVALGLKVEGARLPANLVRNLLFWAWLPIWFLLPRTLAGGAPALGLAALSLAVLLLGRPEPIFDRWTNVQVRRAG